MATYVILHATGGISMNTTITIQTIKLYYGISSERGQVVIHIQLEA